MKDVLQIFALAAGLVISIPVWPENPPDSTAENGTQAESAGLDAFRKELRTLQESVDKLEAEQRHRKQLEEEQELKKLRQAALQEASAPASAEEREPSGGEVFSSGQRALQSLNPEISVVVDAGLQMAMHDYQLNSILRLQPRVGAPATTKMMFRHLGLHLETNLDPFSFTKIAIGVSPAGVGLGEAYGTWVSLLPGLSLTVGKFLQQFGLVNRWHTPSLDQFDKPLALTELLGPGGLNQIGLSFDYLLPTPLEINSNRIIFQVTTPNNSHLFSGEYLDVPTFLLHLQSYWDLFAEIYLQVGLTGMYGMNNYAGGEVEGEPQQSYDAYGDPIVLFDADGHEIGPQWVTRTEKVDPFRGNVWLGGADLVLSWSPLKEERYRHVTWRSELFAVSQQRPDGLLQAMGGYSYVDVGLSEAWALGVRGDVTQPFEIDPGAALRWQIVGYTTWWQSPWVKIRLQASHAAGAELPVDDRVVVQFVWAAGPHKHERY